MKLLHTKMRIKTGIAAAVAAVALLIGGVAFAWFVSEGASVQSDIDMGNFAVEATVEQSELPLAFPGVILGNQMATIRNTGSLKAVAKVGVQARVTVKRDTNGDLLPESDWRVEENPAWLSINVLEDGIDDGEHFTHPLGTWVNSDDPEHIKFYTWAKDAEGALYVTMDGNDALHFAYDIVTDGAAMGMAYQDAEIAVALAWQAVQMDPDMAFEDTFGFSPYDLTYFSDDYIDYPADTIHPFNASTGGDRIREAIASMPDSFYKTHLESVVR